MAGGMVRRKTPTVRPATPRCPARPGASEPAVLLGVVLGIPIDERVIEDGMIRWDRLNPLGRLGYMDYAPLGEVFTMDRPGWP